MSVAEGIRKDQADISNRQDVRARRDTIKRTKFPNKNIADLQVRDIEPTKIKYQKRKVAFAKKK